MELILLQKYPLLNTYNGVATQEILEFGFYNTDLLVSQDTFADYINNYLVNELLARNRSLLQVKIFTEDINWASKKWRVEVYYTGDPVNEISASFDPTTGGIIAIVVGAVLILGIIAGIVWMVLNLIKKFFIKEPGQLFSPFTENIVSLGFVALIIGGGILLLSRSGVLDKFIGTKAKG